MVILTAVNNKYYQPVLKTIKNVHSHFPKIKLIVYDLGLTAKMRDHVSSLCIYNMFALNFY
jgi:hypothetical protein